MKSRKKKISTERYLPPEVLTQVLARLPVKSLLRFRCVSKSWCSLFDNPDFISMHLKLYKNNRDKTHLLVMEGLGYLNMKGRNFAIRSTGSLRKTRQLGKTSNKYWIEGSCNGLHLLQRFISSWPLDDDPHNGQDHNELILWNPSVRKSVRLPPRTELKSPLRPTMGYVLGYAPLSNNYKVVAFEFDWQADTMLSMSVYTLSDNLWRIRDVNNTCFPQDVVLNRRGLLYFEGATHWLARDPLKGSGRYTHLASFDLDTETLSYLELPDSNKEICLCYLGESLAVFSISCVDCCIWVRKMNDGKALWNVCFSGDSNEEVFFSLQRYSSTGNIFPVNKTGTCFTSHKTLYDITNHRIQGLAKSMNKPLSFGTYVESLVLSQGFIGQNWVSPFP